MTCATEPLLLHVHVKLFRNKFARALDRALIKLSSLCDDCPHGLDVLLNGAAVVIQLLVIFSRSLEEVVKRVASVLMESSLFSGCINL
jgi:hypothetical protein